MTSCPLKPAPRMHWSQSTASCPPAWMISCITIFHIDIEHLTSALRYCLFAVNLFGSSIIILYVNVGNIVITGVLPSMTRSAGSMKLLTCLARTENMYFTIFDQVPTMKYNKTKRVSVYPMISIPWPMMTCPCKEPCISSHGNSPDLEIFWFQCQ